MTLHRKHVPPCTPPVTFGGEALQETDTLKLLGVMLDPTLSYRAHTRSVALRASQRLGFLRKAAPILDDHGRVTVYKGFVRPLLEYAPLAWSTNMAQLDNVQECPAFPGTWNHPPKSSASPDGGSPVILVQAALHSRASPGKGHAATNQAPCRS